MPAPLAKGIIITLTLLTALGGALLANPQVRAWVEEQRRKIAEALRSLGDELDPQSRRQAEAFAYEGRIPGDRPEPSGTAPPLARRESEAARRAVAKATGRDTGIGLDETSRRLNRTGSGSLIDSMSGRLGENEEAERKRLGREYLARRNAEMVEAKEKAKMKKSSASISSPSAEASGTVNAPVSEQANPWSFDDIVDENGSLKSPSANEQDMDRTLELPSPPTNEPKSFGTRKIAISETVEAEPEITYPTIRTSGFDTGSRWANPFGDEFELEESGTGYATPKAATQGPPLPPKLALDSDPEISVPDLQDLDRDQQTEFDAHRQAENMAELASLENTRQPTHVQNDPYDEELALALSLSTAEEEERQRKVLANLVRSEEDELAAAIAASLAEPEQQHRNIIRAQGMIQRRNEAARERLQRKLSAGMATKDAKLASAQAKIEEKTSRTSHRANVVQTNSLVDISHKSDPPISVPQTPRAKPMHNQAEVESDSEGLYHASPEPQTRRVARLTSPFVYPPADKPSTLHEAALAGSSILSDQSPPYASAPKDRQDILIDIDDSTEEEQPVNLFRSATKSQTLYQSTLGPSNADREPAERNSWLESDEFAAMLKSFPKPETHRQAEAGDGARTPTTATLSPSIERESIAFSSGDEDDFASAAGSVAHSTHNVDHASPTASFTTDAAPSVQHSSDGHSEAESMSLIDADEEHERDIGGVGEVVEDDDSSDEEWGSGIRTPGSEWTDVGSVVSEEEVGGQDSSRLA